MQNFPIGVMTDSLGLPFSDALRKAAEVGAKGVQLYAVSGTMAAEKLNASKRREILDMIRSNGLVVSAVCGDLGHGFWDAQKNPERIERSKRIVDLAVDLDADIITTHIGVVPADPTHPRYQIMQEACHTLATYADQYKVHFAVETGPEPAVVLKGFLDSLGSKGVAVNFDPANFVMITGDDPVKAVDTLKDYIVHTHAKDGIKLYDKSPEAIYGLTEDKMKTSPSFREVPLGTGSVDFPRYLAALEKIGYRGFLTIEQKVVDDPVREILTAADFLRKTMAQVHRSLHW